MTVNAVALFKRLAHDLPDDLHPHVLIVGSLAAGYRFFGDTESGREVQTKDVDVIVQPAGAVTTCQNIAERLLGEGWRRTEKCFPQDEAEPRESLRAVRLWPRDSTDYFIELLGLPEANQAESKVWVPIQVHGGWYGVPCFRFMAVVAQHALMGAHRLRVANPAMMVLANLLAHPTLDATLIKGTDIRRCAKDLGRVLALAWLTQRSDLDDWPRLWNGALRACFPDSYLELSHAVPNGLRALLQEPGALEEAFRTIRPGLLSGQAVTVQMLRTTAARMEQQVFEPFAKSAD